ncbi:hypothetical protein LXL04_009748 [Taraxacum kok-saghyz]
MSAQSTVFPFENFYLLKLLKKFGLHITPSKRVCLISLGLGLGLRPRTESDIKETYQTPRTTDRVRHHRQILGLRFLNTDRVRGKTSDRVRGLTSQRRYQTLGPRTESVRPYP